MKNLIIAGAKEAQLGGTAAPQQCQYRRLRTGTCQVVGQELGQGQTRPQLTALSTFTWSRESKNK